MNQVPFHPVPFGRVAAFLWRAQPFDFVYKLVVSFVLSFSGCLGEDSDLLAAGRSPSIPFLSLF